MSTTTTITRPAPILEGSLTAFLKSIDKLGAGAVPAGFAGIDTTKFKVLPVSVQNEIKGQFPEVKKWDFKNSRYLGKIEGKLYTLKQLTNGYCSNDNPLIESVSGFKDSILNLSKPFSFKSLAKKV